MEARDVVVCKRKEKERKRRVGVVKKKEKRGCVGVVKNEDDVK